MANEPARLAYCMEWQARDLGTGEVPVYERRCMTPLAVGKELGGLFLARNVQYL